MKQLALRKGRGGEWTRQAARQLAWSL